MTPKLSLLHLQKQSYEIAHLSPRGDFTPKSENRNRPWTDLNIQFQMSPGVSWGRYTIGSIKKNVTPMKKSFLKNNLPPYRQEPRQVVLPCHVPLAGRVWQFDGGHLGNLVCYSPGASLSLSPLGRVRTSDDDLTGDADDSNSI